MAAVRKRPLVARRRRLEDEGEDDASVATEMVDDSGSDVSVPSDVDESADADNSDLSDVDSSPSLTHGKSKGKVNGSREVKPINHVANRDAPSPPIARSDTKFTAVKDTEMMMNGLRISDKAVGDEAVDFEAAGQTETVPETQQSGDQTRGRQETFAERKRREHEEYKKKRDSDPAFIPNRGAFFMHDQRSVPGQNVFRPYGRVRGRGRGTIGGPFSPANLMAQANEATDAPWQHDLHQTVIEPQLPSQAQPQTQRPSQTVSSAIANAAPGLNPQAQFVTTQGPAPKAAVVRSFSTTVHTHNALVRVYLPGMKEPVPYHGVPIKQHTRLPNHRPPLRRDKPVRISLPDHPPRYIFPTVERSFIFIPRALRPNQQGFGRGRGRPFGSYGGGFSSRRTSVYGGSVYSPSVAMSRRSSLAREMGRDGLVSPAGSVMSRPPGGPADPSRPVVRLPPGGPKQPTAPPVLSPNSGTPSLQQSQSYPLPQKPTFRENWQGQLPMHQPRPQKAVSVAGIESPASMNFHPPQQQEQQPFHQQVPAHINGTTSSAEQPTLYPHARQLSYPSQASTGTPLSNIPERAIHAPAFQPFQQHGFPPQGFPVQPGFYYPPQANGAQTQFLAPGGMVPMFVPNPQQGAYVVPMAAPPASAAPAASAAAQPAMVAYESNGMTYYYDPAQVYAPPPMEGYPQPSYAVPGMGGMMTPSPDGYYYPQMPPTGGVYYQP